MKIQVLMLSVVVTFLLSAGAYAGTLAGVGMRDSAMTGLVEKWSIGCSAEWMNRDIKLTHGSEVVELETRTVDMFVGYDCTEWLTLFATLGSAEFKTSEAVKYGDNNLKFSAGIQGNLWKTEIIDPEFLTGNLTLKSVLEFSVYQFDEGDKNIDGYWLEYFVAFPFCYEIFADRQDNLRQVPYSLAISLGPALSVIDGNVDGLAGESTRLKGDKFLGFFGAVDIYFAHNVSVGCQIEYIDHVSVGGNIIYHF